MGQLSGAFGQFASACPQGHGFDLAQLFRVPPQSLLMLIDRPGKVAKNYCRKIDRSHPASGIAGFIATYGEKMAEDSQASLRFLRRFLWVN